MSDFEVFGVENVEKWVENVKTSLVYRTQGGDFVNEIDFVAMSLMSDAQEMMTMGKIEEARQTLNLAKYILSEG